MNQKQRIFEKNCGDERDFILILTAIIAFLISELIYKITIEMTNIKILILVIAQFFILISLWLSISFYYFTKKHEVIT
ncbi:hypothetical protein KAU33_16040 [Candidatus Dependentiae bacterium]|nr:hypothetical protein [Candidatus Dependentiae bacterium]